jgi:hypothetical protein
MHQERDVGIPTNGVNEMVPTLSIAVAVSPYDNDSKLIVGQFGRSCDGKRSSMKSVYAIASHVMRQLGGLADS